MIRQSGRRVEGDRGTTVRGPVAKEEIGKHGSVEVPRNGTAAALTITTEALKLSPIQAKGFSQYAP